MALKFTTTKDSANLSGVKVLVYGKAGVGKTVLCSTAPDPLIISAESGLLSLRHVDIPVIEIKTIDDLLEAYDWVTTNDAAKQFKTICLDSISEIAEIVLAAAKSSVKDARQAYGTLIDEMMSTVKKFRDLKGKHVYFSAKEIKVVDEISQSVLFGPQMPGSKLGPNLPYMFDVVCNLNIGLNKGETYRFLRTASNFQYEAKDRSGALNEFEEPNLTKLFDKIMKGTNQKKKKEK